MGKGKDPAKVDKLPGEPEDSDVLEDHRSEWAKEEVKIEDRKPDLGEIEDDFSEL